MIYWIVIRQKVKACFLLPDIFEPKAGRSGKKMVEEGHEVGNHTVKATSVFPHLTMRKCKGNY